MKQPPKFLGKCAVVVVGCLSQHFISADEGHFSIGSDSVPTYIVSSAILRPAQEPEACAIGAPKMLTVAGIKDIKLRACYCCSEYGSVVFVVDGASQDSVLEAFNKINVPIASIMKAEEVKTPQETRVPA